MDPRGSADSHLGPYRADIDGLRAIAILSVIAFHLQRDGLPGGYLGVDIFFVISGYLITGIIWNEAGRGEFRFRRFYERRVRRIVPALLAVLLASTVVSGFLLLPLDLEGFGKSVLATLAFSANVYFWRDSDYFSQPAAEKPLLHMWSLGVEEQFYILLPLLLILLARRASARVALAVVLSLVAGSLALNIFANRHGAATPAFYLLPTRAWELGFGALAALSPPSRQTSPHWLRQAAGLVGLALIACAIGGLDLGSDIPVALPGIAGATLVIWANQSNPISRLVLESRPMIWVGLVSYSLYLWHWPIIVFARYWLVRELTAVEEIAALALMFGLAAASYRWIERPFRSRGLDNRRVYGWSLAGAGTVVVAALVLLGTGGLPGRLSPEVALLNSAAGTHFRCGVSDYLVIGRARGCVLSLPSRDPNDADVVLLGNSHAQMYAPLVRRLSVERGLKAVMINVNGCLPSSQYNIMPECIEAGRDQLRAVAGLTGEKLVIIAFDWDVAIWPFFDTDRHRVSLSVDDMLINSIDPTIDELERQGKRIALVGPIMRPGWEVASMASRALAFGRHLNRPMFASYADLEQKFGGAIAHFERRRDITFVRPDKVQCATGRCEFLMDGRSLFSDNSHLALAALSRFEPEFRQMVVAAASAGKQGATASAVNGAGP